MANIAQLKKILAVTPARQNVLLVGDHGKGKSEILVNIYKQQGMKVVCLFLGQNGDAGDIIGLPVQREVVLDGKTHIVTDFAPPEWWPIDGKPIVLFLDEPNRGKPEVHQCIMDLLLNHELKGKKLPVGSRIIGAMNPMKDGYYQVEDLDPAFLDRWNVYDFNPEPSEWIEYAYETKVNKYVLGFIEKNLAFLDPPPTDKSKGDQVNPSRRSWIRLSNTLNKTPDIIEDLGLLQDLSVGIIGLGASVSFKNYVRDSRDDLDASKVLMDWKPSYVKKIKEMSVPQTVSFNTQIVMWVRDQKLSDKETISKYATNLEKYLDCVHPEANANFINALGVDMYANKKDWPRLFLAANPKIGKVFAEVFQARIKNDK